MAEGHRASLPWWGHLVENAVGAHLINHLQGLSYDVLWWRDGRAEVDFVVRSGRHVWALEVKSGRAAPTGGLEVFMAKHRRARPLIIGTGGLPLDEFFATSPAALFGDS